MGDEKGSILENVSGTGHEANQRVYEFNNGMKDMAFAEKVGEAELMAYLIDQRTDYEHASSVSSGKAKEMYDRLLVPVIRAIDGDTRFRAEFCEARADLMAREAVSRLETPTAFDLLMFDQEKQEAINWFGLHQRLIEKAEAQE